MRLDKYLADMHAGSRSEVKQMIKKRLVTVNDMAVKDPGLKVDETDVVCVKGEAISYKKHFYYMLNKPAGVITATEDKRDKTVLDLFPEDLRRGLIPVGRLDKDTVGLLLITDDGELAHRLLSPARHVDKVYLLRTDLPMDEEDSESIKKGITLKDGTGFMPGELLISDKDPHEAKIRIHEGKFHQIKRMLASLGKTVTYLKRISMGSLSLDENLPEGSYRELTPHEEAALTEE